MRAQAALKAVAATGFPAVVLVEDRVVVVADASATGNVLDLRGVTVDGRPLGGDGHLRIVNPPLLVPDPGGDVEGHGRRYRTDPGAIVLAQILRLA